MLRMNANKSNNRKGSQASSVVSGGARARRRAIASAHIKIDKLNKSLTDAIRQDDRDVVKSLLANDDDLLMTLNENTVDILHVACMLNRVECAAILLDAGTKVNALSSSDDSTPLHISARKGNLELMALLMNFGANVNTSTRSERRSPLHAAILHGQIEAAMLLEENHARADQRDVYGHTPLHFACEKCRLDIATWLLNCPEVDVNAADNQGWTPLHMAASSGDASLAQLLLARNAYCDCQTKSGKTPCHLAAAGAGHLQVIQLLIDHRASIDITDMHGKFAWEYATNPAIAQLLTPPATPSNGSGKRETGLSARLLEFISISQRLKPPVVVVDPLPRLSSNDEHAYYNLPKTTENASHHYLTLPSITVSQSIIEEDESDFEVKKPSSPSVTSGEQNLLLHDVTTNLRQWQQVIQSMTRTGDVANNAEVSAKYQQQLQQLQISIGSMYQILEHEVKQSNNTNFQTRGERKGSKRMKVLSPYLRDAFLLSFATNIGKLSCGWLLLLENLPSLSTLNFDTTVSRAKRLYDNELGRTLIALPTLVRTLERDGKPLIKSCLGLAKKTPAIPKECELSILTDFLESVSEIPPVIDSALLNILATQLSGDGQRLATQLKLKDSPASPLLIRTKSEPSHSLKAAAAVHQTCEDQHQTDEYDDRHTKSHNLEVLSAWMSQMVAMPKTTAVLQLVNAVIDIGREDLLECIFLSHSTDSRPY